MSSEDKIIHRERIRGAISSLLMKYVSEHKNFFIKRSPSDITELSEVVVRYMEDNGYLYPESINGALRTITVNIDEFMVNGYSLRELLEAAGLSENDMKAYRKSNIVALRKAIVWQYMNENGFSHPVISMVFGYKSRSSVTQGIQRYKQMMAIRDMRTIKIHKEFNSNLSIKKDLTLKQVNG